jgi:tRNA-dihydrouridine synthase
MKKPSVLERIHVARRHLEMSIKWKGERLGILETRRHYSNYFKGIQGFKPFRTQLVTLETVPELFDLFARLEQENESFIPAV